MKILHVLYTSLPDVTGSSIRSDGLLVGQTENGLEVNVITSPFQKPRDMGQAFEKINGIKYFRTYNEVDEQEASETATKFHVRVKKLFQILRFAREIKRIAHRTNSNVIHAHSMFFCGLASIYASRKLRCAFIYEVRSLWEDRSSGSGILSLLLRSALKSIETFVMRKADAVVVINEGLRQNLLARKIQMEKIFVVENCVSEDIVSDNSKKTWTGISARDIRFGYVGNLSSIEGLDILIGAFGELWREKGEEIEPLRIFGSGVDGPRLMALANDLAPGGVRFHGQFNREDLERVYADIDCVVIPRKRMQITEAVTPLKPLEAMAFKKLIMISDVGGLVEVVGPDEAAIVFPADDQCSLRQALEATLETRRSSLAQRVEAGYRFVSQHRVWRMRANAYRAIYQYAMSQKRGY